MGLFDRFKSNKNKTAEPAPQQPEAQTPEQRFEKEFLATIPRYLSVPGAQVNINLRHPETRAIMSYAEGLAGTYGEWLNVKSAADRRGLIYSALDDLIGSKVPLWQMVMRLTDDRYAEKALELGTNQATDDDWQYAPFLAAMATTHFVLTNYPAAEEHALKALAIDPGNEMAQRTLADVYHYTGRTDKAHEIYNTLLQKKIPAGQPMNLPVTQLLGFDGNILFSPVYAAAFLKGLPDINEATWNWAGEEYYHSPHFRTEHAYYLIGQKEHMKGFVKLLQVTREMPWFKEAVLNTYSMIDQLNLSGSMKDDQARLKSIIDQNGWSTQNMHTRHI